MCFLLCLVALPALADEIEYAQQLQALECLRVVQAQIGPQWVLVLDKDHGSGKWIRSAEDDAIGSYKARLFPGDAPVTIRCVYTEYANGYVFGGVLSR